jgi:hypothetical protein
MTATFHSLFRQWQLANEAAVIAEDHLQNRFRSARLDGGLPPQQQEINDADALRANANVLMEVTLVAVKVETPGWDQRRATTQDVPPGKSGSTLLTLRAVP